MKRALGSVRALSVAIACIAGSFFSHPAGASALGDLAASMAPGTFAELTGMGGWSSGAILSPTDLGCITSDYITQYAEKAPWDPVGKRVMFVGQTHGNCYGGRFVIYGDSTNAWSQGPWPSAICQSGTATSPCFSHAYDHNTVDPATGDLYYRNYSSTTFLRFRNGSWSSLPAPAMQAVQCCGALEFFPDMSRLIFVDGDWGVWAFNPSSSAWTLLANTNGSNAGSSLPKLPMSSTAVFALYDPVLKIVLFGGGSNLYKLSASGTITTLKTPPMSLGVTNAVVAVDSTGGKYIVLSGSSMWQYDASTDTWTQLAITVPSVLLALNGVGDGLVETSISTYGVIMYTKYDNGSSKVYLYKHSPTAAVQVKPMPPTSVVAQ